MFSLGHHDAPQAEERQDCHDGTGREGDVGCHLGEPTVQTSCACCRLQAIIVAILHKCCIEYTTYMRTLRPPLKSINTGLFILILIVNAYVVATPFLPAVLARPGRLDTTRNLQYSQKILQPLPAKQVQPNQLIIPSLQLDQPIYEGTDIYTELDKGVLRWPGSSMPESGSNTVLLGHRFTYTNPRGVFYFLDVVKPNDTIGMIWNNRTYTYVVDTVKVVPPSDVSILRPSATPILTIYTCTPTWWPKDRLVVTAHLENIHE